MDNNRKVVELPLDDVLPNRFQPRIKFNEDAITELSESIKEHGVIQPIVVRPIGDRYEIIAGERRFKASTLAGLKTIPAIVINLNDKDSAEVALIENVQRQDLTPIEEAISYKKILDMGYLKQEDLAEKIGKSQSSIANKLRLLNLDEEVQESLLNGKISERHARSLLKLDNKDEQVKLLNKIITERLTVRKTDEEINKMLNNNKTIEPTKEIEVINFDEPIIIPSDDNIEKFNIPTGPIIEQNYDINNISTEKIINPFEENNDQTNLLNIEEDIPKFSDLINNTTNEDTPKEEGIFFNNYTDNNINVSDTQSVDNYEFNNSFVPKEEVITQDFKISPNFGIPTFDDSFFNQQSTDENNSATEQTLEPSNLKNVIDTFRNCEKTIEQYGFVVDTEEFDLEDMYQVVFKVHKK